MNKKPYILSADIGGTKTAVGLLDDRLNLLNHSVFKTDLIFENLVEKIFSGAEQLLKNEKTDFENVSSVAVGCPGPLDLKHGKIVSVATTGWRDIEIVSLFEKKFCLPTVLLNDCKAAALGEYHFGAGKGADSMVYLSISTGIGGALISGGKLHEGRCGNAGEFGHITVEKNGRECGCGKNGCLELYASGTAVESDYYKNAGQKLTVKEIAERYKNNDRTAIKCIDAAAEYLGLGISYIELITEPDILVLGGGVSNIYPLMKYNTDRTLKKELPASCNKMRIEVQKLNGLQNLYGAAFYAKNTTLKSKKEK